MIVHLDKDEIHTALVEYISNQGYPVGGKKVEVSFTAGRGKNGPSAQLSFETIVVQTPSTDDPETDPEDGQQAIKFAFQDPDED